MHRIDKNKKCMVHQNQPADRILKTLLYNKKKKFRYNLL